LAPQQIEDTDIMNKKVPIIIQASTRNFSGGREATLNLYEGRPLIWHTVKNAISMMPEAKIIIAAPMFDKGGLEEHLVDYQGLVSIVYGANESPVDRICDIVNGFEPGGHFVRIDGLHPFFFADDVVSMLYMARENNLDVVKWCDDIPAPITAEVYAVDGYIRARALIRREEGAAPSSFSVHPKFFMMHDGRFNSRYYDRQITSGELEALRHRYLKIISPERILIDEQHSVKAGDQILFHYEYAKRYLSDQMKVLDIASGAGEGGGVIAGVAKEVVCADIDKKVLDEGRLRFANKPAIKFSQQDVLNMDFVSGSFDAVLSMETLEHIDNVDRYLREIKRVLKPGGIFICSTPQNRYGQIPITAHHVHEYSLELLSKIVGKFFSIVEVIGIKAGTIIFKDDPIGANTMLFCVYSK